jgi:hypothetical protein
MSDPAGVRAAGMVLPASEPGAARGLRSIVPRYNRLGCRCARGWRRRSWTERGSGSGPRWPGGAPRSGENTIEGVSEVLLRISVEDAGAAGGLLQKLFGVFSAETVSFDAGRREVRVEPRVDSDRVLVQALAVVEDWLTEDGNGPTRIDVDGHSYLMAPPAEAGARS